MACEIFNKNANTIAKKYVPFVTYKIKDKVEAWVTEEFIHAMKGRDYFLKKQKRVTAPQIWKLSFEMGTK